MDRPAARERLRDRAAGRDPGAARRADARALRVCDGRMGAEMAGRGDVGRGEARMGVPPAPPLILASTSPQRRAILHQLRIPFEVVAPSFDEEAAGSPLDRAAGKARSVRADDRPVLGVDTEVVVRGELLGKPANATEAEAMLEGL